MGTKNKPGQFDCWNKLWPDEPYFLIMGRDIALPDTVEFWRNIRRNFNDSGTQPIERDVLREAEQVIVDAKAFRADVYLPWKVKIEATQASLNAIDKNTALSNFNGYLAGEGKPALNEVDFAQLLFCCRNAIKLPTPRFETPSE